MYQSNKKRIWLPWLAGFLLIASLVLMFHFYRGSDTGVYPQSAGV